MNTFFRFFMLVALCLVAGCQPCCPPQEIEHPRRICVMRGGEECFTLTLDAFSLRTLGSAICRSGTRISHHGRPVNVRPAYEEDYSEYHLCVFGEEESRRAALYTAFPFEVSGSCRELTEPERGYSFRLDFRTMLTADDAARMLRLIPEWNRKG